jgi:hypothetical protein
MRAQQTETSSSPALVASPFARLEHLPRRVTRKRGAELVSENFFPISHRTLESWSIPTQLVNGKVTIDTRALFEMAQTKLNAAPVIVRGR